MWQEAHPDQPLVTPFFFFRASFFRSYLKAVWSMATERIFMEYVQCSDHPYCMQPEGHDEDPELLAMLDETYPEVHADKVKVTTWYNANPLAMGGDIFNGTAVQDEAFADVPPPEGFIRGDTYEIDERITQVTIEAGGMDIGELVHQSNVKVCEHAFRRYNADDRSDRFVRRSLSVGDRVEIDYTGILDADGLVFTYECKTEGWEEVQP